MWLYSVMGGVYVTWEIDNTDLCGLKEQCANMVYNYDVQKIKLYDVTSYDTIKHHLHA